MIGRKLAKLSVLDFEGIERIRLATEQILANTGVVVKSEYALKLLAGAGCTVNQKTHNVKIPSWLIDEACKTGPKHITLRGWSSDRKVTLGSGSVNFATGENTRNILDLESQRPRPTTKRDIETVASLADGLDGISVVMPLCSALDVPVKARDRHEFEAMINHTEKPILAWANSTEGVKDIIKMAEVAVGGRKRLEDSSVVAIYSGSTSPLTHDAVRIENLVTLAQSCLPCVYGPCIQAGVTGPLTLAGTLTQANAEVISALVISQLERKGSPFIYGFISSIIDPWSGLMSYGAPEFALLEAAAAQLAHSYGLPFAGTGGTTDSKLVDGQAVSEAMMTALVSGLAGADLVYDLGCLESGVTASLEMVAIGDEIARMVKYLCGGLEVSDDYLALDLIASVGPGGQFVDKAHTAKHMVEVWKPRLMDRLGFSKWSESGALDLASRARASVQMILRDHQPKPLPKDVADEIRAIVGRADRVYS